MKILKPSTQPVTVSIRVPAELAQRLATARASAAQRGLSLDIDQPLAKALTRIVKQAEAELSNAPHHDAPAAVALENERAEVPHVTC
jgi:hypothetical protein